MSVNRALWGTISCYIRSVQVEYTDNEINIYCLLDGAISEENTEDMSVVGTEVAASFPNHIVYEHCIRADYPTPIKLTSEARCIVFWRKEE